MRLKTFLTVLIFILASQGYVVNGQFTPAEIAQRQEIEEFLKTAEIVSSADIPEGVTKPIQLFLKKGPEVGPCSSNDFPGLLWKKLKL